MPSPRAARVRRHGRRAAAKPPLSVEALWAIKRIASPTLSPDGALACAAVTSFDMETNEESTELWLFPTGLAGKSALKPRRLTAGDKDSDPKWSPDGRWIAFTAKRKDDDEAQIYLIAPDGGEARRLTKVANGCCRAQVVRRRQAHRVRVVGLAGPRDRRGTGETPKGAQGGEGQGARHRARRISLLGPLADRRTGAARVRRATSRRAAAGTRSRAPVSRCRRGIRRASTSTSRRTVASSPSRSTSRPSPG